MISVHWYPTEGLFTRYYKECDKTISPVNTLIDITPTYSMCGVCEHPTESNV